MKAGKRQTLDYAWLSKPCEKFESKALGVSQRTLHVFEELDENDKI